ncbi:MAG: hypothetical protein RR131_03670 [Anaerovorax sp.]
MNYKKYNRTFIMFEEENREFAKNDETIKGHLRVETGNNKGAMRCTLDNLKPFENGEYIYKLIFMGVKKEKTIYEIIGTVSPNKGGNSETYFRFLPLNVDGNGSEYDDFHAAIVAAVSATDQQEPLHPVLKASLNSDEEIFKQKNQTNKGFQKKEIRQMRGRHQSNRVNQGTERQEREERGVKPRNTGENYNRFYNQYVLQACQYLAQMAERYETIVPFEGETDKTGAGWKKISNVSNLPLVAPGAHYFATKYKHYIFGGTEKAFYIGIPGKFSKEEQPDGGESGFICWQATSVKDIGEKSTVSRDYGYWIVKIEGQTGDIVEA